MTGHTQEEKHDQLDELGRGKLVPLSEKWHAIGAGSVVSPMSELGQTEKNSVRAYVFRFALELGHGSTRSACLTRANFGIGNPDISIGTHSQCCVSRSIN